MLITVYIQKNSLPCFATLKALRQQGFNYTARDIEAEPALAQMLASQGQTQLPVVVTDNLRWVGHRPDMINRLRLDNQAANG